MGDARPGKRKGYLRVDITGRSAELWARLRPRMIAALNRVLEELTDGQGPRWFEEQAKDFKNALLHYAKSRLEKSGAEVEKIVADAEKAYSERERNLAEARKLHAEAHAQEIKNAHEELRLVLILTRAALIGEEGKEALLLSKQVDVFLETVSALAAARGSFPTLPNGPKDRD